MFKAAEREDQPRVWLAEPVESRAQFLVVDRNLAVENQGARQQLGDRRRDAGEAPQT